MMQLIDGKATATAIKAEIGKSLQTEVNNHTWPRC